RRFFFGPSAPSSPVALACSVPVCSALAPSPSPLSDEAALACSALAPSPSPLSDEAALACSALGWSASGAAVPSGGVTSPSPPTETSACGAGASAGAAEPSARAAEPSCGVDIASPVSLDAPAGSEPWGEDP